MPDTNHWRMDCTDEGIVADTTDVTAGLPIGVRLPTNYEPGYAYPLIVLFHGRFSNEQHVLRLTPRISDQNFIYLSLRGPEIVGRRRDGQLGFGWSHNNADEMLSEYVKLSAQLIRRSYHVHSERVYLVGVNEGAEAAYRAGLQLGSQIAGVVALNGTLPRPQSGQPVFRMPDARQLRVMIGQGSPTETNTDELARDYRALYAAGADVRYFRYPNGGKLHNHMFRDINQWIVGAVNAEYDLFAVRD
jgi:phospholipase/carboxylesterase